MIEQAVVASRAFASRREVRRIEVNQVHVETAEAPHVHVQRPVALVIVKDGSVGSSTNRMNSPGKGGLPGGLVPKLARNICFPQVEIAPMEEVEMVAWRGRPEQGNDWPTPACNEPLPIVPSNRLDIRGDHIESCVLRGREVHSVERVGDERVVLD
jgi:hypothetical protein